MVEREMNLLTNCLGIKGWVVVWVDEGSGLNYVREEAMQDTRIDVLNKKVNDRSAGTSLQEESGVNQACP